MPCRGTCRVARIAASRHPRAAQPFHNVRIATAAIPAAFPQCSSTSRSMAAAIKRCTGTAALRHRSSCIHQRCGSSKKRRHAASNGFCQRDPPSKFLAALCDEVAGRIEIDLIAARGPDLDFDDRVVGTAAAFAPARLPGRERLPALVAGSVTAPAGCAGGSSVCLITEATAQADAHNQTVLVDTGTRTRTRTRNAESTSTCTGKLPFRIGG